MRPEQDWKKKMLGVEKNEQKKGSHIIQPMKTRKEQEAFRKRSRGVDYNQFLIVES